MATPSQPSPGNQGPSSRDLAQSIKQLIEDQGDYNNLLKNALKDANKMDGVYKRIQARIESMNKDSINIKRVSAELYSLKQKEVIARKNAADLEKELSENTKRDIKQRETLNSLLKNTSNTQVKLRVMKQMQVMDAKLEANLELKALEIAKQGIKIAQDEVRAGEKALSVEKEIRKQVGFTGAAFKFLADKIGVGESLQEEMVQSARRLNEEGKKFGIFDKIGLLGKAGLGALTEVFKDPLAFAAAWKAVSAGFDKLGDGAKKAMSAFGAEGGPITNLAGSFSGMLKNIPLIGGLLSGVVDSFAMLVDFAVKAKSEIQEMGRQIGLSANESLALSNHYHNFATASGKAYLNNKVLLKTQIDMNKELGITNKISDQNVQTAFELMKFAGVELDTVTKMEQVSKITGKTQSQIAGAVMHQVNNFKKLTGVSFSFQGILKEVANLSGYLGLKLTKYPGEIIKSVVAAKGLGLELKQLDSMADGFLDVESSIQKEMEAQVLTGRDINLNRARELFLNNQLVEAGAELSKQLGTSEDFLKMNRLEATSFAEAMGMSRDQVADMLKQQEHLAAFGAGSVKELQKKVALMKEQGREQEAINKLGSEESFNKLISASASEDLAGFIEKIKESLAGLVANTGLADMVQNFIGFLSKPDNIVKLLNKIKDVFGTIVSVIGSVMGGIMRAVNVIVGLFSDFQIDEGMISMVEGAGAQIKSFDMGSLVSAAPGIGDNAVKAQTAGTSAAATQGQSGGFGGAKTINNNVVLTLDGRPIASATQVLNTQLANGDYNRINNPYPGVSSVGQ